MADTPKLVTEEDLALVVSNISQKVNESNKTIILSGKNNSETTTSSGTSSISCGNSAGGANIVGLYAEGKSEQIAKFDAVTHQGTLDTITEQGYINQSISSNTTRCVSDIYNISQGAKLTITSGFEIFGGRADSPTGKFVRLTGWGLTEITESGYWRFIIRKTSGANITPNEFTLAVSIVPTPTNPVPIKDASGVVEASSADNLYNPNLLDYFDINGAGAYRYGHQFKNESESEIVYKLFCSNDNADLLYYRICPINLSSYGTTIAVGKGFSSSASVPPGWMLRVFYSDAGLSYHKGYCVSTTASEYVEYKSNAINIGYINCQFENNKLYYGSNGNIGHIAQYGASVDLMKVKPNTTYTLELVTSGAINITGFIYFDKNRTFISSVDINSQKKKIADFTTPTNCEYVALDIYDPNKSINVAELDKALLSETDSPLHIDLRSIPNTDIADTLTVNEDGSGEWVQKVGVRDLEKLNWTFGWSTAWYTDNITDGVAPSIESIANIMSDSYVAKSMSPSPSTSKVGEMGYWASSETKRLACNNGSSTAKPSGILYYELATPIVHTLTKEQVDAILALRSYQDTTIIESELNLKEVKYLKQCEVVDALKIIKGWFDSAKADPMTTADADALYTEVFGN